MARHTHKLGNGEFKRDSFVSNLSIFKIHAIESLDIYLKEYTRNVEKVNLIRSGNCSALRLVSIVDRRHTSIILETCIIFILRDYIKDVQLINTLQVLISNYFPYVFKGLSVGFILYARIDS